MKGPLADPQTVYSHGWCPGRHQTGNNCQSHPYSRACQVVAIEHKPGQIPDLSPAGGQGSCNIIPINTSGLVTVSSTRSYFTCCLMSKCGAATLRYPSTNAECSATLAEGGIPKGFWSKQRCYTSHRGTYITLAGSCVSNAA